MSTGKAKTTISRVLMGFLVVALGATLLIGANQVLLTQGRAAVLQTWDIGKPATAVAWGPQGKVIAVAREDGVVQIRQVADGTVVNSLIGHTEETTALAFSPDEQLVAVGSARGDAAIRVWRVRDGALLYILRAGAQTVGSLAFSPDNQWLAAPGPSGRVHIWNTATGNLVRVLEGRASSQRAEYASVIEIGFSPDGSGFTAVDSEDTVRQWSLETGTLIHVQESFSQKSSSDFVRTITLTKSNLVVSTLLLNPEVYLWDINSGNIVGRYAR